MRSRFGLLAAALTLAPLPSTRNDCPTSVMPDHYDLAFAVDLPHNRFDGTETITVRTTEPTTRVVLHALEITFHEVTDRHGRRRSAQRSPSMNPRKPRDADGAEAVAPGSTEIHIRYTGVLNDSSEASTRARGPIALTR